jgi:hypothetical protein
MNISHNVTFQGDKGIAAIFYIVPFAILAILIPLFLSYLYRYYTVRIPRANIDIIPLPTESHVVEADDIECKDASISVLIDENYTDAFVKSVPRHVW